MLKVNLLRVFLRRRSYKMTFFYFQQVSSYLEFSSTSWNPKPASPHKELTVIVEFGSSPVKYAFRGYMAVQCHANL